MDPICFDHDLKVTIQALGWGDDGKYKKLSDDIASVAYWYQAEPRAPFPSVARTGAAVARNEDERRGRR